MLSINRYERNLITARLRWVRVGMAARAQGQSPEKFTRTHPGPRGEGSRRLRQLMEMYRTRPARSCDIVERSTELYREAAVSLNQPRQ